MTTKTLLFNFPSALSGITDRNIITYHSNAEISPILLVIPLIRCKCERNNENKFPSAGPTKKGRFHGTHVHCRF